MIVGPNGLEIVDHLDQLETLAQIGTVFILFQHGISYPIDHRAFSRTHVFGSLVVILLQLLFCCAAGLINQLVPSVHQGILYGSAVSISSSIHVVEYLRLSKQSESLVAQHLAAILAIQDMFLTIMLCLPEVMRDLEQGSVLTATYKVLYTIAMFVLVVGSALPIAKCVIPPLLDKM